MRYYIPEYCPKHNKTRLTHAPTFGYFCRYCKGDDIWSVEWIVNGRLEEVQKLRNNQCGPIA